MISKDFVDKYYLKEEVIPESVFTKSEQARADLRSVEYKIFKEKNPSLFERFVIFGSNTIGKAIQFGVSKNEEKKMNTLLYLLGYDFTVKQLYGFALFLLVLGFVVGIALAISVMALLGISIMFIGIIAFFFVRSMPDSQMRVRLSKSSSDLVTFVLYLVIYMRQTPDLEAAVQFASENLTSYLSFDLKKLLWDTAARKYTNIKSALDYYSERWAKMSPAFTDSLFLIESSTYQKSDENRLQLLDAASQRILNGTYESMTAYASTLKEPLNMVYMLGMVLPVLGLVLAPMMMAFVQIPDFGVLLALMYDVGLPLLIYYLLRDRLLLRPAGFAPPDLSLVPNLPKISHFFLKVGKSKITVNAIIPAAVVFALFAIPVVAFYQLLEVFGPTQIYVSLFITAGIGIALYVYFKLSVMQLKTAEDELIRLQDSFAAAAFQMGSFLSQGYPPESTILKLNDTMQNTPISGFISITVSNIKNLGMSLSSALFDKSNGSTRYFPSSMLIASMRVFVESSKKSVQSAAAAMLYISKHLSNLKLIDQQVKSLLDEVTSGMRVEVGFLSPVMAGIVVGMTSLIGTVLRSLASSIGSIQNSVSGSGAGGSLSSVIPFAFSLFNLSGGIIPLYTFQMIIGIYMIVLSVIIGYAISMIAQPGDKVFMMSTIADTLLTSVILYIIIAFAVTLVFSSVGGLVLSATHVV